MYILIIFIIVIMNIINIILVIIIIIAIVIAILVIVINIIIIDLFVYFFIRLFWKMAGLILFWNNLMIVIIRIILDNNLLWILMNLYLCLISIVISIILLFCNWNELILSRLLIRKIRFLLSLFFWNSYFLIVWYYLIAVFIFRDLILLINATSFRIFIAVIIASWFIFIYFLFLFLLFFLKI